MKKMYTLCAIAALLISCTQNNQRAVQQVTFHVDAFHYTTEKMHMPAATILDDESGQALTDLFVFDGTTELAHQTSDMDDFGTITLDLEHGSHNLSFVCTRSTGLTYADGILSMTNVRPTFGQRLSLNVNGVTADQDMTLDRISGQLNITINDVFPATAAEIEFVVNPRYTQLNVATLQAVNGEQWSQRVSCTSKQGQSGVCYTFNHLLPSLTQESTADVTINIYNAGGTRIYSVTIDDVRMASNTRTNLSGNLFTTPSANVSVNHTWNTDINGTF